METSISIWCVNFLSMLSSDARILLFFRSPGGTHSKFSYVFRDGTSDVVADCSDAVKRLLNPHLCSSDTALSSEVVVHVH